MHSLGKRSLSKGRKRNKSTYRGLKVTSEYEDSDVTFKDQSGDYPRFSLRYVCLGRHSTSQCSYEQLKALASQLRIICSLSWSELNSSPRNTNGWEHIPCDQLKADLPVGIPALKRVTVFRFGGKTTAGRIAGYREGSTFHVLFVDSRMDLYDHG